jgi:hypothetical protein
MKIMDAYHHHGNNDINGCFFFFSDTHTHRSKGIFIECCFYMKKSHFDKKKSIKPKIKA